MERKLFNGVGCLERLLGGHVLLHLLLLLVLVGFEALHSVESVEGKGKDGMGWRHICIISLAGGLLRILFWVLFCFGYSSSVSVINISQPLYTTKKKKKNQ